MAAKKCGRRVSASEMRKLEQRRRREDERYRQRVRRERQELVRREKTRAKKAGCSVAELRRRDERARDFQALKRAFHEKLPLPRSLLTANARLDFVRCLAILPKGEARSLMSLVEKMRGKKKRSAR